MFIWDSQDSESWRRVKVRHNSFGQWLASPGLYSSVTVLNY